MPASRRDAEGRDEYTGATLARVAHGCHRSAARPPLLLLWKEEPPRGAKERWGCTVAAAVARWRYACQHSSWQGRSTGLSPPAPPAATSRPGSHDRVMGRSGALAAGSADWREGLGRQPRFGHCRGVKFNFLNYN